MKNLIFIICIFIFPIITYGQEIDSKIKFKIDEINSIVKLTDSIGNHRNEGISEGPIKYNHISGNFGWDAYFLNDIENKNQPIRIRYSETQPKAVYENLNLYYLKGKLIFAELIKSKIGRNSKKGKPVKKIFYFNGSEIIYPDQTDLDIDYVLAKEKTIYKMIYK